MPLELYKLGRRSVVLQHVLHLSYTSHQYAIDIPCHVVRLFDLHRGECEHVYLNRSGSDSRDVPS